MSYYIYENAAAGTGFISQSERAGGPHDSITEEFSTKKEAEAYMQAERENTTVYCVFWDYASGTGFCETHNCYSGNFRGSMHRHRLSEFDTEEEARNYLAKLRDEE